MLFHFMYTVLLQTVLLERYPVYLEEATQAPTHVGILTLAVACHADMSHKMHLWVPGSCTGRTIRHFRNLQACVHHSIFP